MRFIERFSKERLLMMLYVVVIAAGLYTVAPGGALPASLPVAKKTIVLDAGHGGWDPGKVGVNGVLESEINLAICEQLRAYLELGGSFVVTIRDEDKAVGDTKRQDLDARTDIANEAEADIFISIHQNSFSQESVHGPICFYFKGSEEGKLLADALQNGLNENLGSDKKHSSKADTGYYMLKKSAIPAVIVECGFLSNYGEAGKLSTEDYQQRVAWALYSGIIDYYGAKEG